MELIRVLIADDHKLFRDGVKKLLELESDIAVVGRAGDGEEASRSAGEGPDILLFDINMPRVDGIRCPELNNIFPTKPGMWPYAPSNDEDCLSALPRRVLGCSSRPPGRWSAFRHPLGGQGQPYVIPGSR